MAPCCPRKSVFSGLVCRLDSSFFTGNRKWVGTFLESSNLALTLIFPANAFPVFRVFK